MKNVNFYFCLSCSLDQILQLVEQIRTLAPTKIDSTRVKRILLVTSFRTGSSFLGDLLQQSNSHTYYVYEPLRSLPPETKINGTWMPDAVHLIRSLFTCNYDAIPKYNKYLRQNPSFFRRNKVMSKLCVTIKKWRVSASCTDARVSTEMCQRSPVQVIKTTRLGLQDIPKLDLPVDTKIVYLQRDPRAIYSSRKEMVWCKIDRCRNISVLCQEREDDLRALKQWPKGTITLVRYEDLATNPMEESKRLYAELGLHYTKHVQSFVKTHTTDASETENRFSTYRNSTAAASRWKTKLSSQEIAKIQKSCTYTLKHAGYEFV